MAVFNDEIPIAPQLMCSPEDLQSDDGPQPGEIDVPMAGDDFIPRRRHSHSLTTKEDSSGQQPKRARVKETDDEDSPEVGRYTEEYPGCVVNALGVERTRFEKIHEAQKIEGLEPEAPFADYDEWELVKWLMKTVGQTKADEFLKLPIVSNVLPNS